MPMSGLAGRQGSLAPHRLVVPTRRPSQALGQPRFQRVTSSTPADTTTLRRRAGPAVAGGNVSTAEGFMHATDNLAGD
jgi:hypothetical protein